MKLSKKQKQFHHFCNYFKSLEIKTFLQNAIGALFLSPFTLITYAFILAYKVTFMNKSLIEALSSAFFNSYILGSCIVFNDVLCSLL